MCSLNAMPVWSIAKPCQLRLAPRPGSANALLRRIGTVLAWVSPAGLTTVPMTASTPSASSWAIAAAASGVVVICRAGPGGSDPTRQRQLAGLADIQRPQHPAHADPQRARQRQVGEQLVGKVFATAGPEVFVVAQLGV